MIILRGRKFEQIITYPQKMLILKIWFSGTFILFVVCIFLFSCTSDKKADEQADSSVSISETKSPEIISDIPWSAVVDSVSQVISMEKSSYISIEELDSTNVIEAINRKYPDIKLTWKSQKGDTANVYIADPSYLTQQTGTMGAEIFLAESTYSLTEIPGIKAVNFSFKIGDHASPGVYRRTDFKSFK